MLNAKNGSEKGKMSNILGKQNQHTGNYLFTTISELFACVIFRISLFAEVYHELFNSTMTLRNTICVNI